MAKAPYSFAEVMTVAKQANDYARQRILRGSTQIENNALSMQYFNFLWKGVAQVRREITELVLSNLVETPVLAEFECTNMFTAKFSLGNCQELSMQGLDYILSYSDVRAELYCIRGGDHVFVVLNRPPKSDPKAPSTWGATTVFCDPWSNKVYSALDYASELKNYCSWRWANRLENFDSSKHQLVPLADFNTEYLKQERSVARIIENYRTGRKSLIESMDNFRISLHEEKVRLVKKYGPDYPRVMIIDNKLTELDRYIVGLQNERFDQAMCSEDYRASRNRLNTALSAAIKQASLAMQFTKDDRLVLFEPEGSVLKKNLMKFFAIRNTSQVTIDNLAEKTNKRLSGRRS